MDRYSARRVIVTSLLGLAACLVGLSFVQPPLWHFYALYVLAGLVGISATPVTFSRIVANLVRPQAGSRAWIGEHGNRAGSIYRALFGAVSDR